jgi:predicted metalloprotease with PDZ domain
MLALWQRSSGGPVSEDDILQALQQLGGRAVAKQLHGWVHGLGDLPLKPLLQQVGIEWKEEAPSLSAQLGLRLAESPLAGVHVKSVLRDGAAESAGVSPGDELLAVNGWRVRRLDDAQAWVRAGAAFELLLVRDQRLLTLTLTPPAAAARTPALSLVDKPAKPAAAARRAWLHG